MTELLKTIMGRKSVRTFDGKPVSADDRERIERYILSIRNPFDIPIRFVLLDAKEHGLSSPVLSGETLYVAGITDKVPYADVAYGYSFEKLVLYAWSLLEYYPQNDFRMYEFYTPYTSVFNKDDVVRSRREVAHWESCSNDWGDAGTRTIE